MLVKKILLLTLFILSVILLIGMTRLRFYTMYEYKQDNEYLLQIEESTLWNLVHTEDFEACNEYGCFDGNIKYYRATSLDNVNNLYTVFVTINTRPNNMETQVTDTYITTEKLKIYSDVNKDLPNSDINLSNYFSSTWNKIKKNEVKLSINNLLGKKDLNQALNDVGYYHSSDSTQGIYQGNFDFEDNVEDNSFMTYYVFAYPKTEDIFKNSVSISVNFKKTSPLLMFIKTKNTLKLEVEYKIEFDNKY